MGRQTMAHSLFSYISVRKNTVIIFYVHLQRCYTKTYAIIKKKTRQTHTHKYTLSDSKHRRNLPFPFQILTILMYNVQLILSKDVKELH